MLLKFLSFNQVPDEEADDEFQNFVHDSDFPAEWLSSRRNFSSSVASCSLFAPWRASTGESLGNSTLDWSSAKSLERSGGRTHEGPALASRLAY